MAERTVESVALRVANLWAGYGRTQVLNKVSLEARNGQKLLVYGPNGSGKSTLLKAIGGLCTIQNGESKIFIGEREISRIPVFKRHQAGLGYLLQNNNVFPSLTVGENLELAKLPDGENGAWEEQIPSILLEELLPIVSRRSGLLSGGQRQLLALAMVLKGRPKVLLLDEPLAGLSPGAVDKSLEAIQELFPNQTGGCVLIVEHNIERIKEFASGVLALRNGTIDPLLRTVDDIEARAK